MLFNSLEYLIFLPIVFVVYWLLNSNIKLQNLILLAASYFFYAWWDWRFLSLIIFSSIIDYTIGLQIDKNQSDKIKKRWLFLSLAMNLGLLSVFKYYNFFATSFVDMVSIFGWQPNDLTLNIILPVGISFYTFQTLSYTIDIYRGQLKATKDGIAFFTYIAFFPQLVAGPIERASNLLPQIASSRKFCPTSFKEGLLQIFVGLFRKIVIADTLGAYVDAIYANPGLHNSSSLILATIFYAFQIYFDFAGYSDIAIGSAKLFGFRFNQNFNLPYFSKSLTEFWRKWHISLSSWLKDYLYISLGGNRKGLKITYRNLLLTMLLGGLWHGSSWNFVIWGAIHGIVLSFEKLLNSQVFTASKKNGVLRYLGWLTTFIIVLFSWIFFRAQNFETALEVINNISSLNLKMPYSGDIAIFINSISMLSLGILFDSILYYKDVQLELLGDKINSIKLVSIVSALILLSLLFYSSSNNFIYFQF